MDSTRKYKIHWLGGSAIALAVGMSGGIPLISLAHQTASAGEFTATDAEEEGYWYSRYNLGNMAMRSGIGQVVTPNKKAIVKALAAVDADFDLAEFKKGNTAYGDGDHAMPAKNVAPIATVYKSGDPHLVTKFNPPDFGTQRWDPAKMDKTLTGAAHGYAITKEVEWARQFHVDDHFGTPQSDFGAYWRFVGEVMTLNAKMQSKSFLKNMSAYDLTNGGDAVMLMALSDLSDLLAVDNLAHSEVANRYKDEKAAKAFAAGADKVFALVYAGTPTSIQANSTAIQSLVWYAAKTNNSANKRKALKKIVSLSTALENLTPKTAAERAFYLRGLIDAKRTLGVNDGSIRTIGADFLNDFDMENGVFKSQDSYSIDDVGAIMGALNAMRIFETADIDAGLAEEIFKTFWENAVNKGGLQQSAPPVKIAKSPFEYEGEPKTFFRYGPSQPIPPKAGGKYGIAPVFGTSVGYKDGKYTLTDGRFDSAGAMHASNEMIWFHYDEINGFPEVDLADVIK